MPIYEYQCDQCGQIEEALQRISDKPLKKCNNCSGKLHKLISHSAFHLKGTGWYVTDYAGKNQNNKTNTNSDNDAQAKTESTATTAASTTTDKAKTEK